MIKIHQTYAFQSVKRVKLRGGRSVPPSDCHDSNVCYIRWAVTKIICLQRIGLDRRCAEFNICTQTGNILT